MQEKYRNEENVNISKEVAKKREENNMIICWGKESTNKVNKNIKNPIATKYLTFERQANEEEIQRIKDGWVQVLKTTLKLKNLQTKMPLLVDKIGK